MKGHRKRGCVSRLLRVAASAAAICTFCVSVVSAFPGEDVPSTSMPGNFREASSEPHDHANWFPGSVPPSCASAAKADDQFLLVVSTIDGSVSAMDMRTSGDLLWSVKGDDRPLLSSSITNIQVTRDGVSTRLIPSLDGGLYEFDGEDIKAIPMTAESLLSSSVRLTDNCVMVGGKEVGSYGVDVKTGQLSYRCTSAGCHDAGEAGNSGGDMLVITRNMQTVRAVDVNSGIEKWNFSVGQHDLLYVSSKKDKPGIEQDMTMPEYSDEDVTLDNCFPFGTEEENNSVDEEELKQLIKVVVSEGLIVGLNPDDPTQMSWSRKFSSPVAKAWILHHGKLETLSLFDSKFVPSLSSNSFHYPRRGRGDPLLYVGTHKRQLYVQREEPDRTRCEKELPWVLDHEAHPSTVVDVPRVTWRPYLSNARHQTPIFGGNEAPEVPLLGQSDHVMDYEDYDDTRTSLAVWHENYPFDMGYYLYPQSKGKEMDLDQQDQASGESIMDVLPASLWMWWKEVVAISLLTSLFVHVFYTRFIYRPVVSEGNLQNLDKKDSNDSMISSDSNASLPEDKSGSAEFKSRFADEFECIEQLGKGGFGIVFRARNTVDEQEYAVKRIALPVSDGDSKKKMLREVRTLAMLDHVGIVRYFHSWIEDPPAGWQEERDREFHHDTGTSGGFSPSLDTSVASSDVTQHPASSHVPATTKAKPLRQPPSLLADTILLGAGGFDFDANSLHRSGTGSGEFSVHSEAEKSTDESGSFSLGGGEPVWVGGEESKDSFSVVFQNSDTESSVSRGGQESSCGELPFKHYGAGRCRNTASHAGSGQHADEEESCSIVFEDSHGSNNNYPSVTDHSKSVSCEDSCDVVFENSRGGVSNSHTPGHSDSVMFTDSSYGGSIGDNDSEDVPKPPCQAVEFTLSSHGQAQQCAKKDSECDGRVVTKEGKTAMPKLYLYLQMQLCHQDTLKDWLMNHTPNRERLMTLDIFEQIVSAVHYVHAKGLIHRDLKPSNIFFALDNTVKVGDFGLVTATEQQPDPSSQPNMNKASTKHTADVGTQLYMSPEQVQKKPYDQKVDIFSLGMIFLELRMPFSTGMERITTLQNARKGIFPQSFCKEEPVESDLVKKLMSGSAKDRPTAEELLGHDLLKDFYPRRIGFRYRTISGSSSHSDPALSAES